MECSSLGRDREKNAKMADSNGCSKRGFSVTFSDLTMPASCSPDVPCEKIQETPDYIRKRKNIEISPVELFAEERGLKNRVGLATEKQEKSPEENLPEGISSSEVSLKCPQSPEAERSILSLNAGGVDGSVAYNGKTFEQDNFYTGGDIIRTDDVQAWDDREYALYHSARFGDFSYEFPNLEEGDYLVDLHLAEIVFTNGPSGIRVFDVYIQEEKAVSGIDIYSKVGPNHPLILSNLEASVVGREGLSIKFKGLVGKPIVCGISIRRDVPAAGENVQKRRGDLTFLDERNEEILNLPTHQILQDNGHDHRKWKRKYDLLIKEQIEMRKTLKAAKCENELKSQECHEAWASLRELQMELMRKSLHVGSLAFAVEGQVKDKGRWCLCVGDLWEKFKLMKQEHSKIKEEALEFKNCFADMIGRMSSVLPLMDNHSNLERKYNDLKLRFIEESKERKNLYNKMVELKGNIRVFCRCRPLSLEEISRGEDMAIDFESAKDGELLVKTNGAPKKVFKFDAVFVPEEDQVKVFEKTSHLATSVLDGYNVCIFAYGQTGTGKTFTMEGTEGARGVNFRTLEELFRVVRERQGLVRYDITVSVLEVYNEQIHDLLLSGYQPGVAAKRLEVRTASEGVHHVPGLVEARVNNTIEAWEVLQTGSKARSVGSTNANEHSSRSHCIHCVLVRGENLMNGECTRSKLWLIDLAGSERITKTDAQGERLKEAQSINKSLSALGDVISALATKSPHVPFRNSKLTHLLQDSLGGDSKTLMFVQISPSENDVGESLCSLNFASRVRGIELGLAKKQFDGGELFKNKQMFEKAKQEIRNKELQIKSMEEMICSVESKNKAKDLLNRNLQEKIKELESQLLIERKLARQHVDSKIAENHQQQQKLFELNTPLCSDSPQSASRPLMERNQSSPADQRGNLKPIAENSNYPSSVSVTLKFLNPIRDKENKPELAEEIIPRKANRLSLENAIRRISMTPTNRRDSLIPPPVAKAAALAYLLPQFPLPIMDTAKDTLSEGRSCSQGGKRSNKKNSIQRRSLQKKLIIRSPLPQSSSRGHATGEKLRVSIGNRGWRTRRVPGSDAKKTDKIPQLKRQQKEKERGWNLGTSRNAF
ncbi:kinesin-like protein KIN-14R isoform X3 [Dendrobium catenatum]|uniref:kinesin-like protein KIN-14R isoform X3 n=1 Tax=Dendrobium catenatum TaxID=906689 RepID=UPI00109F8068|nr:kinesin-like protein KIN-14R isoform X3 [Dendrobium catenatum]